MAQDLEAIAARANARAKPSCEDRPEFSGLVRMLRASVGKSSPAAREISATCRVGVQVSDLAALFHVALMEVEASTREPSTLTPAQRKAAEALLAPHGLAISDNRLTLSERTKLRTDLLQVGLRIVEASKGTQELPSEIRITLGIEAPAEVDHGDMITAETGEGEEHATGEDGDHAAGVDAGSGALATP